MSSFDEQLALTSPPVPARSPDLDAEFVRVIAQAEEAAAPRPRRRRSSVLIGGLVAVGALGVGGAAAATAGVVPWFESAPSHGVVTTSTGAQCTLTFDVKPLHDPAAPVSGAVRAKVAAAAEDYLTNLDVSALTVDDREASSAYDEVARGLDAELVRQQLPTSAVSLGMLSSCDGGDR